jgi:hypothetical protein
LLTYDRVAEATAAVPPNPGFIAPIALPKRMAPPNPPPTSG